MTDAELEQEAAKEEKRLANDEVGRAFMDIVNVDNMRVEETIRVLNTWHPFLLAELAKALLTMSRERKHDERISWLAKTFDKGVDWK